MNTYIILFICNIMSDYRVRQIVRDEMRKNEMWDYFWGNPITDNKIRTQVQQVVALQLKQNKHEMSYEMNKYLNNDSRVRKCVDDVTIRVEGMVTSEVRNGADKIKQAVQAEIDGVVRADKYNSINQGFIADLKTKADYTVNTEISRLKTENNLITSELKTKYTQINNLEKKVDNVQNNMKVVFAGSTVLGATLGVIGSIIASSLR
jgi:hypothetical protein